MILHVTKAQIQRFEMDMKLELMFLLEYATMALFFPLYFFILCWFMSCDLSCGVKLFEMVLVLYLNDTLILF